MTRHYLCVTAYHAASKRVCAWRRDSQNKDGDSVTVCMQNMISKQMPAGVKHLAFAAQCQNQTVAPHCCSPFNIFASTPAVFFPPLPRQIAVLIRCQVRVLTDAARSSLGRAGHEQPCQGASLLRQASSRVKIRVIQSPHIEILI